MDNDQTRICYICLVEKDLSSGFYFNKTRNNYYYHCTHCHIDIVRGKIDPKAHRPVGCSFKEVLPEEKWEHMLQFLVLLNNHGTRAINQGVKPDVNSYLLAYRKLGLAKEC